MTFGLCVVVVDLNPHLQKKLLLCEALGIAKGEPAKVRDEWTRLKQEGWNREEY